MVFHIGLIKTKREQSMYNDYINLKKNIITGKHSTLTGLWDDITGSMSAAESNIENVVLPYWSSKIQSVAGEAGKTIGDLLGWLQDIDASIASGNTYYKQLVAAGKNTSQDDAMAKNIAASQTDLNSQLQGAATAIQNGATSGNGWQTVNISSNPAEPASPNTFNVTTDLLSPSGTSGLGIIPVIVGVVTGVAITGVIVYKIYELHTNSAQYSEYMQARAEAIKNGTPLPPLPPALAQYTASSWVAWLLGGIVVAGIAGTIIYVKYFRKHESHVVYNNPRNKVKFSTIEKILKGYGNKPRISKDEAGNIHLSGGTYGAREDIEEYFRKRGLLSGVQNSPTSKTIFIKNPYHYSSHSRFTHHEIEPSSHFKPESIRTIKRHGVEFIVGRPKSRYMGHTGKHGGATRAIAELRPR